jgi:hypothetical protein
MLEWLFHLNKAADVLKMIVPAVILGSPSDAKTTSAWVSRPFVIELDTSPGVSNME